MKRKQRKGGGKDPGKAVLRLDPVRASQLAEGRARAWLEAHEEVALHEEARSELHHLKAQAVTTLQAAMLNTGCCPACGSSGLVVDKTAVQAALGVLDRAGFPPAKEIQVVGQTAPMDEAGLLAQAVGALLALEGEQLGSLVARIVAERPDAREPIERALQPRPMIQASIPIVPLLEGLPESERRVVEAVEAMA